MTVFTTTFAARVFRLPVDVVVTLALWAYFTIGFVLLFLPFYLVGYGFAPDRQTVFQRLNCSFFQLFFSLVRLLIPGHRWDIADTVRRIRSSVVVCNHRSYLDPILLMALFPRHRTIVKSRLLRIPIFGRELIASGYMPDASEGRFTDLMIERLETLPTFFDEGGVLFVFPEGTRSRSGRIGRFDKGAFKIAKRFGAPLHVLVIDGTDRLYAPGRFWFRTAGPNTIQLREVARIAPPEMPTVADLADRVRTLMAQHQQETGGINT